MRIPLSIPWSDPLAGARTALPFAGLARRMAAAVRRWRQRSGTHAELSALDAATLRDIGVEPSALRGRRHRDTLDAAAAWDIPWDARS